MPPALTALMIQLLALSTVALIAAAASALTHERVAGHFPWALLQGIIAAIIGHRFGMAVWWLPLHLLFAPALVTALAFALPPLWFFGGFVLLALVYGKTYQTQVPFYLSSRAAARTTALLLPEQQGFSFLDVGSGCGGLLRHLGKVRPDGNYHGVEAAPLPYLLGKCRNFFRATGCRVSWGDFWNRDFAPYDVVYAYLSPVPMAALWRKAHAEMRPGSIFISNSFAVPGVTPDLLLELDDFEGSRLHVWRM
jgi:SAM-dependent methyltransferase